MEKDKILYEQIKDALENIAQDRGCAFSAQADVWNKIQSDKAHGHKEYGKHFTSYLELCQRSNEQLIKIISIVAKISEKASENDEILPDDFDECLDMIQEEKNKQEDGE